ncbi:hypothetical protein [uncultured Flavobacterium sp.]|uniref:hypothetical protein n=1 Tax=uncultured Flavobacterium sp. TaxID=165435 RepID=UPI00259142F9|nr:hypothetical protein [uncultured Flavobacterium sp.]
MHNIDSMYDSLIESESLLSSLEEISKKAPSDSLCSAIDPDGNVVSICGSAELYSSPEAVYFKLLEALYHNQDKTVSDILYNLSLNITYTR